MEDGESDEETIEYSIEIVDRSSSSLVSSIADNLSHSSSLSSINQDQNQHQINLQQVSNQHSDGNPDNKTGTGEEFVELVVCGAGDGTGQGVVPVAGEQSEIETVGDDVDQLLETRQPDNEAQLDTDSSPNNETFVLIEVGADNELAREENVIELRAPSVEQEEQQQVACGEDHFSHHEPVSEKIESNDQTAPVPVLTHEEEDPKCPAEIEQPFIPLNPEPLDPELSGASSDAPKETDLAANDLNVGQQVQTLVIQLEAPSSVTDLNNNNNINSISIPNLEQPASIERLQPVETPEPPSCASVIHSGQLEQQLPAEPDVAMGQSCAIEAQEGVRSGLELIDHCEVEPGDDGVGCLDWAQQQDDDRSESPDIFEDTMESPLEQQSGQLALAQPPGQTVLMNEAASAAHEDDSDGLQPPPAPSEEVGSMELNPIELDSIGDVACLDCVSNEDQCKIEPPSGGQQQASTDEGDLLPSQLLTGHDDTSRGDGLADQVDVEVGDFGCPEAAAEMPQISVAPDNEDDDLEHEFDNEPPFERRQIEIKLSVDPRSQYLLQDELGRGKFGTVYRCVEQASGRSFAAKFVHMRRREDRDDVNREIEIMSLLQHKRLLQLFDAYDDGENEMCLITELVDGGELFERIVNDDFELTEKKAAIFVRQICEGVEYMHGLDIVHLDMKPENILCVSRTGNRIKLIDFGLARKLSQDEPLRVMFGTPDFAAPEVLAYDQVSLATDMWSVGVICYVLLSGLSPFMGDNDMDTMANVTRATYDFDDEAFDPISDLAKDFISKLLIKDQPQRLKPAQCLQHPWLQRGGAQLEASLRERRNSMALLMMPLDDNEQQQVLPASGPLLDGLAPESPPPSLDKRKLKKYVIRRKWHKTVHAIMALQRMGANLKWLP